MNRKITKTTVYLFLILLFKSVISLGQTIPSSPIWFDSCLVQDLELLLENPRFNVNMVFEPEQDRFDNETPLMHAVRNKNPRVTELLLKAGATINAETSYLRKHTATVFAVNNPNVEVLKLLIAAGANIEQINYSQFRDNTGTTLLHHAMRNPNPEIFKLLLKNGANPLIRSEMGGNTVLMSCARWNPNPEVISVLLDAGLNINEEDDFGQTALTLAIEYNPNPEVIRLLIDKGGDLSIEGGCFEIKNVIELAESNPALKNSPVFLLIKNKFELIKK